jgi:hypothetical protein
MQAVTTIGLDIARSVFQVQRHGVFVMLVVSECFSASPQSNSLRARTASRSCFRADTLGARPA